jgi:endogenous inhibitor of DNA gyrase (YacG/DUF329 family)
MEGSKMKNHKKNHICPNCQKSLTLKENITWVFGSFCSRRCLDADLLMWLEHQYVGADQEKDPSQKA